jgi:acetyl esterase
LKMGLDPNVRNLLDQMAAMGAPPLHTLPPPEARIALASLRVKSDEPVKQIKDFHIPGTAHEIPVRMYTPEGDQPLPILVYFHGGGWALGDLESHDGVCRSLANQAGCIVVSVDYRLAPENKFPAAAEDAYAATTWVAENAASLGGNASRIAVGGDSAGGNLAAVVALMARDSGTPNLSFQLLVYPVIDKPDNFPSYAENAEGYFLTRDAMFWFYDLYTTYDTDPQNPLLFPIYAESLANLPPALVITAEFDPLRDEGEAYAQKLQSAGTPVTLTRYDGMIHGFYGMQTVLAQSKQAIAQSAQALKQAFAQ